MLYVGKRKGRSKAFPAPASRFRMDWLALQRLFHFRQYIEEVCNQAVIGDLEDRCFLVLVDGDDDLGILHTGKVLDGTGNAAGNVEIGCNDLAGLADLPVVRCIACIDRSTRGANGSAQLVGDGKDDFHELLFRAERPAAGDDDLGRGKFRAVALDDFVAKELRKPGVTGSRYGLDGGAAAIASSTCRRNICARRWRPRQAKGNPRRD